MNNFNNSENKSLIFSNQVPSMPAVSSGAFAAHSDHAYFNYNFENERPLQDYLRYYWSVAIKYRWLITTITVVILLVTFVLSLLEVPKYATSSILSFEEYQERIEGSFAERGVTRRMNQKNFIDTQLHRAKSLMLADLALAKGSLAKDVAKELGVDPARAIPSHNTPAHENSSNSYRYPLFLLNSVRDMVEVNSVKGTSLVKITAYSTDPRIAQKVANAYGESFIEMIQLQNKKGAVENIEFYKRQSDELAHKITQMEAKIANFAEENAIIRLNQQATTAPEEELEQLNLEMLSLHKQRVEAQTKLERLNKDATRGSSEFKTEITNGLLNKIQTLNVEYAMLGNKFTPSYPKMVEIRAQVSSLRDQLELEYKNIIQDYEAKLLTIAASEKAIGELLEAQKRKVQDISQAMLQYNSLSREYESLKNLHQTILGQLKDTQVAAESSPSNIMISEYATMPGSPFSPNRKRQLTIALLIGPFIGFAIALLLETLDNTFQSYEDVAKTLHMPTLGVIPQFDNNQSSAYKTFESIGDTLKLEFFQKDPKKGESDSQYNELNEEANDDENKSDSAYHLNLVTFNSPLSIESEAYRAIRTSLMLSSADRKPHCVLVTSSQKEEGKSITTANLAVTMAQTGMKTLLIDCDLRRPTQHKIFSFPQNCIGIADYLSDQANLGQIIIPTKVDNLFVVPAGSMPPNPSELLGSQKMLSTILKLKAQFDFIIIDTPPVVPVTDAVAMSAYVDGVIMVIKGHSTPRQIVEFATERLKRSGAKMYGVILNSMQTKHSYGFNYYYNQAYTYEPHPERKSEEPIPQQSVV